MANLFAHQWWHGGSDLLRRFAANEAVFETAWNAILPKDQSFAPNERPLGCTAEGTVFACRYEDLDQVSCRRSRPSLS